MGHTADPSVSRDPSIDLPLDKMATILADDILKCIFLNQKVPMLIKISLRFDPKGLIDNNQIFV